MSVACVTVAVVRLAVVHGVGAGGRFPSSHDVKISSSPIIASIVGDEGRLVASGGREKSLGNGDGGPDMGDGVERGGRDMLTSGDERAR